MGQGQTSNGVELSAACHPDCIACRSASEGGLGLRFHDLPDGGVATRFACDSRYQGYPGRLHGGIIATLLDAAMTHCLFARRIRGYTARLEIRYEEPVATSAGCRVRAALERERPPLYYLRAELWQDDVCRARAEATFHGGPVETFIGGNGD